MTDRRSRFILALVFLSLGTTGVYGISYHLDREYGIGTFGLWTSVGIFMALFTIVAAIGGLIIMLGDKRR